MPLKLTYEGATDEQLVAGLAAAFDVFNVAGVQAEKAAEAYHLREASRIDPRLSRKVNDEVERLADLWIMAQAAAHRTVRDLVVAEPVAFRMAFS
jgi:hypothetical protein